MLKIVQTIIDFFDIEKQRKEKIDNYLNQSVDIYDLERRMEIVDRDGWNN